MAATDGIQEIGGNVVAGIFNSILIFGIVFILLCAIGFIMWWVLVYKKKFNIRVKIISARAGDKNKILFDQAAILRSRKDQSHFFRLWSTKIDLPAPNFNVLQSTNKGDYIEVYRTSENTIYYLTPPQIDKTYVIRGDGKKYFIASQKTMQLNQDMEFWNVKRKSLNKKMFDTEKLWMKILPFIPHIIGGVVTIFVLYILMSYLPEVLAQLTALVSEMRSTRTAEIVIQGV